jgi:hypothetical protein
LLIHHPSPAAHCAMSNRDGDPGGGDTKPAATGARPNGGESSDLGTRPPDLRRELELRLASNQRLQVDAMIELQRMRREGEHLKTVLERLDGPTGWIVSCGGNMLGDCTLLGTPAFPIGPDGVLPPTLTNVALRDAQIHQLALGGSTAVALSVTGIGHTWGDHAPGGLGRVMHQQGDDEDEDAWLMAALPFDDAPQDIVQVVAGSSFCLVLTSSGKVYMSGAYRFDGVSFTIDSSGTVHRHRHHQALEMVPGLDGVTQLFAGESSDVWFALTKDGKLKSCGTYGLSTVACLVHGSTSVHGTVTHMPSLCALNPTGLGLSGQLCRAIVDPMTDSEIGFTGSNDVNKHVLDSDGILKQLLTPQDVDVPEGLSPVSVECGQNFVLLLARDHSTKRGIVLSAGANDEGQLGNGMPTGHGGQVHGFQQKLLPVSPRWRERVKWEECAMCSLFFLLRSTLLTRLHPL